ncbi:unnamed protein product [Lymnaea stagnalis]|uniref:Partner and localiser of BRCA2 WD40 domain-containing protein n=1 Tax=Lymnaea stagnalis TaxID=6523 RepID=A0AAV2IFP5_LYMST
MENSKEEKLKKLVALKQDYARKKKKLEKCKHAAQVKAHVRQKIKEHEEIEQQSREPPQTCYNQTSQCNAVTASISVSDLTSTKVSANEGNCHDSLKPFTAHNATVSSRDCSPKSVLDDQVLSTVGKTKKETSKGFREKILEPSLIEARDETATLNVSKQNIHSTEAKKEPIRLLNDNWVTVTKGDANALHRHVNKGNPLLHVDEVRIMTQADRKQVETIFNDVEQTVKPEEQLQGKVEKSSRQKESFHFLSNTEEVLDQDIQKLSTSVNEKQSMKDTSEHLNTLLSQSSILNQDKTKLITVNQTEHSTGRNSYMKPTVKKRKMINSSESDDEIIMASQVSRGVAYSLASSAYRKNAPNKMSTLDILPTAPTLESINLMSPNLKGEMTSNTPLCSISDSEFLNILGVTPIQDSKTDPEKTYFHENNATNEVCAKPRRKGVEKLSLAKNSKIETNYIISQQDSKPVSSNYELIFKQVHLEHDSGSIKSESTQELGHIIPETETSESQGPFLKYTELDTLTFTQTELPGLLIGQSFTKAVKLGRCVNRRSARILSHNSEGSIGSSNSSVLSSKSSQREDIIVSSRGVTFNKRSLAQQKKAAAVLSVFQFLIEEAVKPKWVSEFQLPVSFTELRKIKETILTGPKPLQEHFSGELGGSELDGSELVFTQSNSGQSVEVTSLKPEAHVPSRCCNEENTLKELILSPLNVSENVNSEQQVEILTSAQENFDYLSLKQQSIKQGRNLAAPPEDKDCQSDSQTTAGKTITTHVCVGSQLETDCCTSPPERSQNSLNVGRKLFEQKLVVLSDTKITTNAVDMMKALESETSSHQNKTGMICTSVSQTNPVIIAGSVSSPNLSLSCDGQSSLHNGQCKNTEQINSKSANSNDTVASNELLEDVHLSLSVCQDNLPLSCSVVPCSPSVVCTSPQPDIVIRNDQATPSIGTPSPVVHSVVKRNSFSLTSTPKTTRPKSFASRLNMSSYLKNSKMLFECNKGLDRSEKTLEICSPKPRCLKSVDDETPNTLEPKIFSPLLEKSCPKINKIINGCDVRSPDLSANLSNILQFEDSYLSPGQIPVNTLVESSTNHLGSSMDCSMLLVEPWKKLPRTPTTPLQVLEYKSAQNSHIPVVFTPTRRISRSQTNDNPFKEERTLKFSGCFQSCSQDAVVSVLCGQLKLESGTSTQFIVSVQATSLTLWTEDDHFGWTTELDWRLAPEIHIMKATLLPVNDRIAVIASGLDKGQLFVSLFVYICSSEDTKRFNIPLTEFQTEINSPSRVELCVASATELLVGLSTDSTHLVVKVIFSDDLNSILSVSKFDRQPSQLLNVVVVKNLASAFMTLSTDQNISIWNIKLGNCLKKMSLPSSVPCLTAMIAAKAYQGFLILDTIWRVDNGDCGGIVILNPVTCKAFPVVAFPSPNSSWRRTENAQKEVGLVTALNDRGSLCIWERKTGKIVGHTKSNLTTCASLMASNKTLLVGEIHGCLHLYRT